MLVDVVYSDYASPSERGKVMVWDADASAWREPTSDEKQQALEQAVLDLHWRLRKLSQ